jgi:uncharacterized protein (DUF849 family)
MDRPAVYLKAAVNGGRSREAHPATPVTPEQIARDAAAVHAAGAAVVHAHARTPQGAQTIDPELVGAMVTAVHAAAPGAPVGTTTGLWTCSGPGERLDLVKAWDVLPDFASVAYSEEGADEVAELVLAKGMVLESAMWSLTDLDALLASRVLHENVRILIEPEDPDPAGAVEVCREAARRLRAAGVTCPLLYHGDGPTVWPVVRAALADGAQVRIGLEDGTDLPDGSTAADNVALVNAVFEFAGTL